MSDNEIEQLLNKTTDELFIRLGEDGSSGAIGFDPIRKGKEMFANIVTNIQERLCKDKMIKESFNDPKNYNKLVLISSIADIIAQLALPISPYTVAVLCVKEGLDNICKTTWDE